METGSRSRRFERVFLRRRLVGPQETLGLETTLRERGNRQAIKATLMNDKIPSSQKIVGSSALTSSKPTIEVDVVFDSC